MLYCTASLRKPVHQSFVSTARNVHRLCGEDTILNSLFQLWMLGALDNLGAGPSARDVRVMGLGCSVGQMTLSTAKFATAIRGHKRRSEILFLLMT